MRSPHQRLRAAEDQAPQNQESAGLPLQPLAGLAGPGQASTPARRRAWRGPTPPPPRRAACRGRAPRTRLLDGEVCNRPRDDQGRRHRRHDQRPPVPGHGRNASVPWIPSHAHDPLLPAPLEHRAVVGPPTRDDRRILRQSSHRRSHVTAEPASPLLTFDYFANVLSPPYPVLRAPDRAAAEH